MQTSKSTPRPKERASTLAFDVAKIREDFPILHRQVDGRTIAYLDNAATTQKPKQVIDTLVNYYTNYNANIHRGIYRISEEATAAHEAARAKIARFINASSPQEIVFVRGTTEAINLVAQSWGRHNLGPGDGIILTHMPVDVQDLDCDFLAFSGHKMCGPTGIGVLYAKKELLDSMPPFHGGGEMIREVHMYESTWKDPPYKFEAGTTNIAGAIGLGAAVDYLNHIGMRKIRLHEQELTKYALDSLSRIKGISIYGPKDPSQREGVISFNIGDIHAHDMATLLDEDAICVRSGHHCAQPLMERLGVSATTRASFYLYNTEQEVDRLVESLEKAKKVFKL